MAEALMGTREIEYARRRLGELPRPVRLVVFHQGQGEAGVALERLAGELAALAPNIVADTVRLGRGGQAAEARRQAFGIEQLPAVAVTAGDGSAPDNGIRFYGFPGGYEFDSLLDAIGRVSRDASDLSPELARFVDGLPEARLQVFVTPTCPYCPRMVQLAHRLALRNPGVRAEMVDAAEFPELADRFGVQGVPLTVVDGSMFIEGAVPEARLLQQWRAALAGRSSG